MITNSITLVPIVDQCNVNRYLHLPDVLSTLETANSIGM